MIVSEIILWLNDPLRDYYAGVIMYDEYGKSSVLKTLFKIGKTDYSEQKLFNELKALMKDVPEPKREKPRESFQSFSKKKKPNVNRADLPERLKALDIKKSELVNEARYYKVLMTNLPRTPEYNEERRKFAQDIEWCFDKIDHIWKEINHFLDTGKMIAEKEQVNLSRQSKEEDFDFSSLTPLQLHKKLHSVRSMINRAKKENKPVHKYLKQAEAITNLLNHEQKAG
jgi:hypothetical protein